MTAGIDLFSPLPGQIQYQSASPGALSDQRAIDSRPSEMPATSWNAPFFKVFDQDERGRDLLPVRVLALTPGYLAFDRPDLDAVQPIIGALGEFLPIRTTQGQRWYLRPTAYLDGLSLNESGAKFSSDGKRVIWFDSIVIRNEAVGNAGVFKVNGLSRSPVLYTPDVVEKLLALDMFDGVDFKQKGRSIGSTQS